MVLLLCDPCGLKKTLFLKVSCFSPYLQCVLQKVSNSLWCRRHKGFSLKVWVSLWFRLNSCFDTLSCKGDVDEDNDWGCECMTHQALTPLARRTPPPPPPPSSFRPSRNSNEIQQPWFWACTHYQSPWSIKEWHFIRMGVSMCGLWLMQAACKTCFQSLGIAENVQTT